MSRVWGVVACVGVVAGVLLGRAVGAVVVGGARGGE